ncbi:MAG: putative ABC transporter ATP-binding protein [bacterium ADurb.BinA186]|nr:MAG: putative ABC transporter ATP-binding protein [bacterium ADurb.BinA186]
MFLTQRLLWPFTRLAEMTDLYQRAMASADRVLDLLQIKTSNTKEHAQLIVTKGEILFFNVSFSYPNKTKILDRFNLKINPGQTTAIVGTTGAGKSTLIKLLLRFYEPTSGQIFIIFIDGQDIANSELKSIRQAISLVS